MITADDSIRNNPLGKQYHLKYYSDTIVSKYLTATNEPKRYDILHDIISKYKPEHKPSDDVLIIHLRVGEVLDRSKFTVDEFLQEDRNFEYDGKRNFVKSLPYYKEKIEQNVLPSKIKFFAGGCFHTNMEKNMEYITKVSNFFKENNFEILENTYFNIPDDDFVYMCRSKHFIKSGGGFSKLVENMREIYFNEKDIDDYKSY